MAKKRNTATPVAQAHTRRGASGSGFHHVDLRPKKESERKQKHKKSWRDQDFEDELEEDYFWELDSGNESEE